MTLKFEQNNSVKWFPGKFGRTKTKELKENHAVGAAEGKTYDEHHERNHNSESGQTKIFQEAN